MFLSEANSSWEIFAEKKRNIHSHKITKQLWRISSHSPFWEQSSVSTVSLFYSSYMKICLRSIETLLGWWSFCIVRHVYIYFCNPLCLFGSGVIHGTRSNVMMWSIKRKHECWIPSWTANLKVWLFLCISNSSRHMNSPGSCFQLFYMVYVKSIYY